MTILLSWFNGLLTFALAAGIAGAAAWLFWNTFKLIGRPGCGPVLVPLLVVLFYDLELKTLLFAQCMLGVSGVIAYFMLEEGDKWRKERAEKRHKQAASTD